ncbi:MAG: cellulase family glycosylhydrolase, partial [Gemmatimonadota bacterium]
MTPTSTSAVAMALSGGLAACAPAMQPLRLHPDNPHYFEFRRRPTVLVTSGEHYGAVLNLDFDYLTYLDELHRHGLNLTRTFSGMYCESWGEGWNTLNPAPGRFLAPWARSETPGYADGGSRFGLDRWDDAYFARLRDFVAQAGQRDIVVELVLFCVFYGEEQWDLSPLNARNNVNGIGTAGREHVYDESDPAMMAVQERLVRRLVEALRDFDNVYFELCNEPYFDGPALGSPWNDRIVRVIREASGKHLVA